MLKDLILLSIDLVDGKPPTERLMFSPGLNTSRKGTFLFDKAAAKSVMDAYAEHGIKRLQFDFDHGMVQPIKVDPEKAGKSAGSWIPEIRGTEDAPELWMADMKFTKGASAGILDEEWNHFSPAFAHDKEGRITRVVNCALTNLPAMDHQKPLLAASLCHVDASVLTTLAMSTEEVERAVESALEAAYPIPMKPGDMWQEKPDAEAIYPDSVVFKIKDQLWQQPYHFEGDRCVLDGTCTEVKVTYAPVTPPEGVLAANEENRPATAAQSGVAGKEGSSMKDLIVLLGMAAGTAEADAEAQVVALSDFSKNVLTLSGQPNMAGALGTIQGWKASADKLPKVEAELATLTASAIETERAALITANQAKIAPAMMDWAKSQPLDGLKAFLAVAPDLVALNASGPTQPAVVTLSADEIRAAKANGFTVEEYAAHKAAMAKEGA